MAGKNVEGAVQVWKLVLAYDGTDFQGWQIQPERPTIQGKLRAAIERVTGEDVLPQGAGRTDAGVHAFGQVASFALAAAIPEQNLVRALNRRLPAAIRVLSAQHASEGFHARHNARAKLYEYRIYRGEICPPFLARYANALNHPLDLEAMRRAAERVIGEYDFTSFAAHDSGADSGSGPPSNVRTITTSEWIRGSEMDLLVYRVRGTGFLHHMVRNLVGTFLEVGRGNLGEEEICRILRARARASAGPTAPACGLCLLGVEY